MRNPIPLAPGSTEFMCLGTGAEPSQAGREEQVGLGCTGVRMPLSCSDGDPAMPQVQPQGSHLASRLRGSRPCFHHQPWHSCTAGSTAELLCRVGHVPTHPQGQCPAAHLVTPMQAASAKLLCRFLSRAQEHQRAWTSQFDQDLARKAQCNINIYRDHYHSLYAAW